MQRLRGAQVYLDSNIFIALAEGMASVQSLLVELFDGADAGHWRMVTSDLTLAEVLIRPLRLQQADLVQQYEELLGGRNGLRTHTVDRDILRKASALAAESNMKLPDAIHAATAQHCSCQFLITEDKRLRSFDQLQVLRLADLVIAPTPPAETP
jgi:predicted nucleic acid-binding protein